MFYIKLSFTIYLIALYFAPSRRTRYSKEMHYLLQESIYLVTMITQIIVYSVVEILLQYSESRHYNSISY